MPFTTRLPKQSCEVCGHILDAATHITDDIAPSDGDFTLCIECGAIYRYQIDMSLRLARNDELNEVDQDELKQTMMGISSLRKRKTYM